MANILQSIGFYLRRAPALAERSAQRSMSVEMLTDVWVTQQIASTWEARFA